MEIKRLQIENFKRIAVVDITPDQKVMMITGKNGNGKTSVLDGIWAALSNPRISEIPKPIKDGEDKAIITIDLDRYLIRRTFTLNDDNKMTTRLTVTGAEGAEFKSPQKMLDKLIGGLSFDPLAFTRMSEKDQVEMLLKLSGGEIDFEALDAARNSAYTQRTSANSTVKELSVIMGDEPTKIDKIDISDIQQNMELSSQLRKDVQTQTGRKVNIEKRLVEIQRELNAINTYLEKATPTLAKYKAHDEYKKEIDIAIEHNQKCGDWNKWNEQQESLKIYSDKANEYTNQIKAIDQKKKDAIANLKLPYPELSFNEGGVTYKNIPIKQASKAEQIRISMAIAMAMNPEIRVLRIEDGSLLDEDNLKLIHELAEQNDYQVWIESVGIGDVGIILENGEVYNAA